MRSKPSARVAAFALVAFAQQHSNPRGPLFLGGANGFVPTNRQIGGGFRNNKNNVNNPCTDPRRNGRWGASHRERHLPADSAFRSLRRNDGEDNHGFCGENRCWQPQPPPREPRAPQQRLQSRNGFLRTAAAAAVLLPMAEAAGAFEGGVGGLGKTRPETGVELFDETSAPIQNEKGIVSSEIRGRDGAPILVSFRTPWPLLPTSGALEARDVRSTESAFVQVVSLRDAAGNDGKWKDKKVFQRLLMDSVFAAQGKFGAYGQPFDIQVKASAAGTNDADTGGSRGASSSSPSFFAVKFTTLTPAMRESERKAVIAARQVGADTLVLLVVTTTSARYASNEKTFRSIASSFEAVAAPESGLKKRTVPSSPPKQQQ